VLNSVLGQIGIWLALCAAGVGGVVVVVSPDGGWKYLSTGAWTEDLDVVVERARHLIYF